ncbi:restriction endonuclease subunit S [Shewanella maritima]|uniref:restriction endonuclease subunit S n=1 Tax=Shewanella maritima TaxID=2520507 RepID=UPI0037354B87
MTDKQTVKFGDICKEVKLTTKDPIGDGYERYIGLEHLDSDTLKIKRWGMIAEDNPSFTRVFKKGQILLGKRRPYLKKAAIAEFDGICSGDIIVLEHNSTNVHKDLLPFIVQSRVFWDWAVKTSSGSLSPRTKFSALSELELSIPAIEKQLSALSILKKIQDYQSTQCDLVGSFNALLKTLNKEIECLCENRVSLAEVSSLVTTGSRGWAKYESTSGSVFMQSQNIKDGYIDFSEVERFVELPSKVEGKRTLLENNDLVFTATGNNVGNVAVYKSLGKETYVSQHVALVRLHDKKLADLVGFYFQRNGLGNKQIAERQYGQSKPGLNLDDIKSFKIPIPSKNNENRILRLVSSLNEVRFQLEAYRDNQLLKLSAFDFWE